MGDDGCQGRETVYNALYFFRRICSPLLVKFLARELKNSKFIQDSLRRDSEDATYQKTLFDILKNVDSKGKRERKNLKKLEQSATSATYEINNLKDNKDILERVQVKELLERGESSEAVAILRELDVKFLLCVLVNGVLGIPFNDEAKRALDALRELRNSNTHHDRDPELQKKLWKETEQVHKYLHGETDTFKEIKKSCCPEETFKQILEDVKQEIDERYQTSSPEHHTTQLTILHHQEYCQLRAPVQNLLDFLVQKQKSCCQEPQPIVLCGEPGAGKSFVLDSLIDTLRKQNDLKDFLMVVKLRNIDVNSKKEFWEQTFTNRCPQAIKNHKVEEVERVLRFYASKFLFLVDCNLQKETLDKLISYMGHGLWVLSFQGAPDYSKRFHLLEVAPLSEDQIYQVLKERQEVTPRDRNLVRLFENYEHKDLIKIPEMVHLFADICSENGSHIPFYELIRRYIDEKVKTNEMKLIELGKQAFDNIKSQKRYTEVECALRPLFKHDANGYFFKYRKVEDYLAAKYVVADPENACKSWLQQATLFTTVFHVVCFLWSDQDNGIQTNDHFIREYLEKIIWGDWKRGEAASDVRDCKEKKRKQDEATSEGKDCTGKKRKPDTATSEVNDCKGKKMKKEASGEGKDCVTIHKPFERWICLSKFAKDYQNNEGLLKILAAILTPFDTWLFKYTPLTPELIDSLSQVLKHVKLTQKLTIKMESGTNVQVLSQLWTMLRSHSVLSKTSVHLTIHYQDSKVTKYEEPLAEFCDTIYNTTAPLYITHYTGPLLCSKTPQFFKGWCLQYLDKYTLDVYITDLASLSMVLSQNKNRECLKRLRVRLTELTQPLEQLQSFPRDFTIIYFKGLQKLLDSYKPDSLCSLKIHEVYIHDNFHLDLTRFTKLELLSIRFVQKEEQEKVGHLPLEEWLPCLVKHLRLPARVERLLMRNMAFLDDSSASVLVTLFKKVTYQRLVLLDTDLSIAKFREIMGGLVASSRTAGTEDTAATPPAEGVRRPRLQKAVREARRKNKPSKRKELIVTSEAELFKNSSSAEEWSAAHHNFVNLVKAIDSSPALSINYSGKCVAVRKDVCGDLFVKCPLPFLDDTMAEDPERHPELGPVLEALALAERISLHYTNLSYKGALRLLHHLKERIENIGRTEPFKLTIGSCNLTNCSKTKEELEYSYVEKIYKEDKLAQFNFSCKDGCHFFKKAIDGTIFFNDVRLRDKRKR